MNSQIISQEEARQLIAGHLNSGFELVGLHDYTYPDGQPAYCRIRLKRATEKKIYPVHRDQQGQFILKEPAFTEQKKPIYRLRDLGYRTDEVVYIVEGESCADRLLAAGILATTSGGSSSAGQADWGVLRRRRVIIWPDADSAGISYATKVTEALLLLGCAVQWICLDNLGLPEGGDCVDWFNINPSFTAAEVVQLPLIEPPANLEHTTAKVNLDYPRFDPKEKGVYYCKDAENESWICSPLNVLALTRDNQSDNWGRVLEFIDADCVSHQWTMPMELLSCTGEELSRELLRLGLRIAPGPAVRKLLVEYITAFETDKRARCVLTTGWYNDCFVLLKKVYGKTDETVLLQTETRASVTYGIVGSLADWRDNISALCIGNSRLTFAVSLALAPTLLRLVGAENGGFHFRGESSSGKSTVLCVSASVWGGRDHVQSWRATDNGLEGLASQHNDTLLILDELSQIDPRCAGEAAYMLANGQSKARAGRTGTARQRFVWRLLFLSSGEISLSSHMLEAGKRSKAGQEVRMVDIPADCGCGMGIFENIHGYDTPGAFANHLKLMSARYYGVAGDAFLEKLVSCDDGLLNTKLHYIQSSFMKDLAEGLHGQGSRVAQRFALVAAAGEIATEFGITGWAPGDAIANVRKCFNAWLVSTDGCSVSHEQDVILNQVRHFFQENAARFDAFDNVADRIRNPIPQRCAGYRSDMGDFYVFTETFRNEICRGLGSSKDVAKIIEKEGWLMPSQKNDTPYSSIWVPMQGKTMRLYHFSGRVLGESYQS